MKTIKTNGTEATTKLQDTITNETTTAEDETIVTAPEPITTVQLPTDYLANGYYATADKGKPYLRPELVDSHAQSIATALSATMTVATLRRLTTGIRTVKGKQYPFEARQTALVELSQKVAKLVKAKKLPPLVKDFITANKTAIQNDDDFKAFLRHLEAIQNHIELGGDT